MLASLLLTCFHFPLAAQAPPAPEPVKTSITVVETISAETPANVSTLDASDLQQTPGVNLDDRLRSVPGFSLFRRSSSLVANPTTQGVSLRGLGSSGASRTLVLWDGIPVNDSFGGWVYWTQSTNLAIASSWTQGSFTTPVVPAGATHISVGMGLDRVGSLTMDDFGLVGGT